MGPKLLLLLTLAQQDPLPFPVTPEQIDPWLQRGPLGVAALTIASFIVYFVYSEKRYNRLRTENIAEHAKRDAREKTAAEARANAAVENAKFMTLLTATMGQVSSTQEKIFDFMTTLSATMNALTKSMDALTDIQQKIYDKVMRNG